MFDNLSTKLEQIFKKLRGHGKLTESNIEEGLKEVRMALLEADVHYKVVKSFIISIKEKALGQEVLESLTPGQQIVKIVNEELIKLMGSQNEELKFAGNPPFPIMLVGLQGSGKTTTAGKLAIFLRKKGKKPYLVPVDIYRPAAIDQLKKLGEQIAVPVFDSDLKANPVNICLNARISAQKLGCDTLIIDTAGRLHIDELLMQELKQIKQAINPSDIIFVADAMTGQDAVNIAKSFNDLLDISGVILTKMDGDARGGAALSIKSITGKPIKFIGTGEKLSELELFHPDRIVSSILGMGDVLTLIEKAQTVIDQDKAIELEKKFRKNEFTLEDFKDQMSRVRKMGSLTDILGMIPGFSKFVKQAGDLKVEEKELNKIEAIINSMTPKERRQYTIIDGNRKKRIAKGSGTTVQDINKLLKNYAESMKMIKMINKGGMKNLGKMPFFK